MKVWIVEYHLNYSMKDCTGMDGVYDSEKKAMERLKELRKSHPKGLYWYTEKDVK